MSDLTHQDLLDKLQDKDISRVANDITALRLIGPPPVEGSGLMPAGDYDNQETFSFDKSIVIVELKEELGPPAVLPNMQGDFKNTVAINNEAEFQITNEPKPGETWS